MLRTVEDASPYKASANNVTQTCRDLASDLAYGELMTVRDVNTRNKTAGVSPYMGCANEIRCADEIYLRWMKSLRDEIRLRRE